MDDPVSSEPPYPPEASGNPSLSTTSHDALRSQQGFSAYCESFLNKLRNN